MKCTLSIYIDKSFQLQKDILTNCCQFVIMHMLGMLSQLFHIRSVEDIEGFQSNNLEFHFIF